MHSYYCFLRTANIHILLGKLKATYLLFYWKAQYTLDIAHVPHCKHFYGFIIFIFVTHTCAYTCFFQDYQNTAHISIQYLTLIIPYYSQYHTTIHHPPYSYIILHVLLCVYSFAYVAFNCFTSTQGRKALFNGQKTMGTVRFSSRILLANAFQSTPGWGKSERSPPRYLYGVWWSGGGV